MNLQRLNPSCVLLHGDDWNVCVIGRKRQLLQPSSRPKDTDLLLYQHRQDCMGRLRQAYSMADFRRSFLQFFLLPALLPLGAVCRLQWMLCLGAVAWQTLLPEPVRRSSIVAYLSGRK